MKKLLICLGLAFFLLLAGCEDEIGTPPPRTGNYPAEQTTIPPATKETESPPEITIPEPEEPILFEPIVITGSGDKTSPPFMVTTAEWVIDWSYEPNPEYSDMGWVFWAFVYPRGETDIYIESILFPEETSGSTYSYAGAGEYYLKVGAAGIDSWEIIISPAK